MMSPFISWYPYDLQIHLVLNLCLPIRNLFRISRQLRCIHTLFAVQQLFHDIEKAENLDSTVLGMNVIKSERVYYEVIDKM